MDYNQIPLGRCAKYLREYAGHLRNYGDGSSIFASNFMAEYAQMSKKELLSIDDWDAVIDCYVRSGYYVSGINPIPAKVHVICDYFELLCDLHNDIAHCHSHEYVYVSWLLRNAKRMYNNGKHGESVDECERALRIFWWKYNRFQN